MNRKMLYTNEGTCRLCGCKDELHADECPGKVIERLRCEVSYRGSHCNSGCCGYTEGTMKVDGPVLTEEELQMLDERTENAVQRLLSVSLRWADRHEDNVKPALEAYWKRKEASALEERKATAISEAETRRTEALAALKASAAELSPLGLERRRAAIDEAHAAALEAAAQLR